MAALLLTANLAYQWPGALNPDSQGQMAQIASGRLHDWHPPAMTRLWQALGLIFGPGPAPMLVFDLATYWAGLAIVALLLVRAGRPLGHAAAVLAAGAVPLFLMLNIAIGKDASFCGAFLLGAALLIAARTVRRWRGAALAGGAAMLGLAVLMRHNALFVAGPLIAYAVAPAALRRPFWTMIGSVLLGLALVPVAGWVNHRLLGAADARAIASLQYFDLAGIAAATGDTGVFGAGTRLTERDVRSCFAVEMWDTLSPWGRCPWFTAKAGDPVPASVGAGQETRSPISLDRLWIAAILRHPFAYAGVRLRHFNSETYFFVPEGHVRAVRDNPKEDVAARRYRGSRLFYALRAAPVFMPGFFLAIALAVVGVSAGRRDSDTALGQAAPMLAMASLLYGASYLVVGVATDLRYFLTSDLAALVSAILAWGDPGTRGALRRDGWRRAMAIGLPVLALVAMLLGRVILPVPTVPPPVPSCVSVTQT